MRTCEVDDCERIHLAKGLCGSHYNRLHRYGFVNLPGKRPHWMSNEERFWNHVLKQDDDCWLWISGKTSGGYGSFKYKGKATGAHRVSWMIHNGDIGDLHVLHHCDNPVCVNPDHLFLGTHQDNMDDMMRKGRRNTKRLKEG